MKLFSKRAIWILWWFGVPCLTFLSVFGPYWVWNIAHHVVTFWRTPIYYGAMFDITWYMPLIGSVVSGFQAGGFLHWFSWPLLGLSKLMPGASIPEIWFVSRWIMTTIGIWSAPWCFQRWATLSRSDARLFSIGFWFSLVLALGMRPGIYGWWLPICFFGLTAARIAYDELRASHVGIAIVWSLVALAATWIYTWFFIMVVIWLATLWTIWFIKNHVWALLVVLAVAFIVLPFAAIAVAHWAFLPHQFAYWQMYERIGFAYTHMPYVTNSFLIVPCWIILLVCFPRLRALDAKNEAYVVALQFAWIALLLAWQFPVFMGVALQNEHFRVPVVLLGWISAAVLYSILKEPSLMLSHTKKIWAWLSLAVLAIALIFIARNFATGYVYFDEYLNVLHLSHWFILAGAAWCVWRYARTSDIFPTRRVMFVVLVVSAIAGTYASAHIYRNELVKLPGTIDQLQLVDFLRATVPTDQAVCADPVTAAFLGIHIARLPHPTVMTKFLPMTDADALKTLTTIAGAYDVVGAGYLKSFKRFVRMDRYIPCASFGKENAILKRFGLSDETIQRFNGCQTEMLGQEQQIFKQAVDQRKLDETAFRAICPWVVIPQEQRQYWRLPKDYIEHSFPLGTSVWSPYLK